MSTLTVLLKINRMREQRKLNTEKNASTFRFSDPHLLEAVFLENLGYNGSLSQIGNLNFQFEKTIGNKLKKIADTDDLGTSVFLTVSTGKEIEFNEEIPCYLRVTMRANFFWNSKEISENDANKFLNINAPALLLSYIRPKIHDLTKDADIPTQDLPFIDFANSNE